MPELPETETIARDLSALVVGRTVRSVKVNRPDVLRLVTARRLGTRLAGRRITRTWRRAKIVVLDLSSDDRLLVQPRFTGRLLVMPEASSRREEYAAVRLSLDDGRVLVYADVRRLGTFALATPEQFGTIDRSLGIEPLDPELTSERFSANIRVSERAVKSVLMDQRRVAGVGNIYANEALWSAEIDPSRPASSLTGREAECLFDALRDVLRRAIAARGTTFRDYRDAAGERGGFAAELAVYGRSDAPCPRCGTHIAVTHAIDGRSAYFCFRCQT